MTAASILALLSAGLVIGFAPGWACSELRVSKRQPRPAPHEPSEFASHWLERL